jgi:hypothetical protein
MAKLNVLGWKHSKGDFNGTPYDYVTVYTVARMQAKDNQRGYAGIEMRGEPSLVEKLRKLEFNGPISCEVETETVATGKGTFAELVINVTPVTQKATA